jgi:hypothetical protein
VNILTLIAQRCCSIAPRCPYGPRCVAPDVSRLAEVELAEFFRRSWHEPVSMRLTAALRRMPGMPCHLRPLGAVLLTQCSALTEIGVGTLRGCVELKSPVASASLQKVGQDASGCSGPREIDAGLASPVIGERSMAYCVLLECASFGDADWEYSVLFGCPRLKEVHTGRIARVRREALQGSSIERVPSLGSGGVTSEALETALAARWSWRDCAPAPVLMATGDELHLASPTALVGGAGEREPVMAGFVGCEAPSAEVDPEALAMSGDSRFAVAAGAIAAWVL